jgi:hypothetical protein
MAEKYWWAVKGLIGGFSLKLDGAFLILHLVCIQY